MRGKYFQDLDVGFLETLECVDDGKELGQVVDLFSFTRIPVQPDLIVTIVQNRKEVRIHKLI